MLEVRDGLEKEKGDNGEKEKGGRRIKVNNFKDDVESKKRKDGRVLQKKEQRNRGNRDRKRCSREVEGEERVSVCVRMRAKRNNRRQTEERK